MDKVTLVAELKAALNTALTVGASFDAENGLIPEEYKFWFRSIAIASGVKEVLQKEKPFCLSKNLMNHGGIVASPFTSEGVAASLYLEAEKVGPDPCRHAG